MRNSGEEKKYLALYESVSCVAVEKRIYFYTRYGDLMEMDLSDGQLKYCGSLEIAEEIYVAKTMYFKGEVYGLILETGSICKGICQNWISLKEAKDVDHSRVWIRLECFDGAVASFLYSNGMYFYNIDLAKRTYEYKRLDVAKGDIRSATEYNGKLYCVLCEIKKNSGKIIRDGQSVLGIYDLRDWTYEEYTLGMNIGVVCHFKIYGTEVVMLNEKNQVWLMNLLNHSIEKVWEYNSDTQLFYVWVFRINGKYILIPQSKEGKVISYDKSKNIEEIIEYPEKCQFLMRSRYVASEIEETIDEVYMSARGLEYVLKISKRDGIIEWIKLKRPEKEAILKSIKNKIHWLTRQEGLLCLEEYIELIVGK